MEIITWCDATSFDEWYSDVEDLKPVKCQTVGYVLKETENYVAIASTKAFDGEYTMIMVIPKGMIEKRVSILDL